MKKLLCLLVLLPLLAWGQEKLTLKGSVADNITHKPIPGTIVKLMYADSTLIDSKKAGGKFQSGDRIELLANYYFDITKEGKYIISFIKDDYDVSYLEVNATNFRRRELERAVPTVYLQRILSQQLQEITVTATKIKFYNKADTLIYNADAFQLSEGSMLDALVRQLPGAELRSDGQIYVNGKFVKSLLLNGKDFFKGNNQIMLDNLPSYMVNDVKVYEKAGEMSQFLNRDMGDKELVMNVNLKKQYSIGWIANIEGGIGTKDRYLGRMFATRFTDHSQISIYGNVNNLNDARKPGQNDNWSPASMSGGLLTTQMAGLDYSIDDRDGKFKLNGNAQFKHSDNNIQSTTSRTNFLPDGDTFDRILNSTRNYNTNINTYHRFYFNLKGFDLEIKPTFNYQKYHNKNNSLSATFSDNYSDFSKEQLDSIFTPGLGTSLRKIALNRNMQKGKANGHDLNTSLFASSTIKLKYLPDAINLSAFASFNEAREDKFIQNRVDYYSQQSVSTDFLNQYFRNNPGKGYDYSLKASYIYAVYRGLDLTFHYKYDQNYTTRKRSLYRLDKLEDWGSDTDHEIGTLPSTELYENTLDAANSYNSRLSENSHQAGASLVWNKYQKKFWWWAQASLPVTLYNQTLKYQRAGTDTTLNRRTTLLELSNTFLQWQTLDRRHTLALYYKIHSQAPDMNYLVNVRDNSDPLNITEGNPDLKNSYTHSYDFSYNNNRADKQRQMAVNLSYTFIQNALAMGYTYDKSTGVRTIKPDNVNGNWNGFMRFYYSSPLDKKRLLTLRSNTFTNYYNNVDLIGVENSATSNRSIVHTLNLTESFRIDYKLKNSLLGAKATVTWSNATSKRNDFTTINAVNFNYGLIAQLELPWKFQLGTDLTMYSRRGYDDQSMNTDDIVWNARISRPILKGRLLLMLDGFDIIGQLSNVTRTLNAQGRTEVYTNVIPRYVMFHAVYRLNIQPKKKKGT